MPRDRRAASASGSARSPAASRWARSRKRPPCSGRRSTRARTRRPFPGAPRRGSARRCRSCPRPRTCGNRRSPEPGRPASRRRDLPAEEPAAAGSPPSSCLPVPSWSLPVPCVVSPGSVAVSPAAASSGSSFAKTSTAPSMATKNTRVAAMNQPRPRPGNCGQRRGMTSADRSAKTTNAPATSASPTAFPVERPSSTARNLHGPGVTNFTASSLQKWRPSTER